MYHFVNESKSATLKEALRYNNFKDVIMMKPAKGAGYDVNIKPGESKTVLMKLGMAPIMSGGKVSSQV